jgi:glycerol-3-phosphate O-acyltransferase
LEQVPLPNRVIRPERLAFEMDRAMAGLLARGLVQEQGDAWSIAPDQQPVLRFYANSIAHFFK